MGAYCFTLNGMKRSDFLKFSGLRGGGLLGGLGLSSSNATGVALFAFLFQ